MDRQDFRRKVAPLVHRNAQVGRTAIFGPDEPRLRPVNLPSDADTMFAGYIGRRYQSGGVVVVAINPGGGRDAYRKRTPADEVFYPLLEALKTAADEDVDRAFESVNDAFVPIVQQWPLWRILRPTIDAACVRLSEICYLNVVPYRTHGDKMPPVRVHHNWPGPDRNRLADRNSLTASRIADDPGIIRRSDADLRDLSLGGA